LEKIKYSKNNQHYDNFYFWRNYQQQEIDLVEESAGVLHAYEIKRNPNKKNKDYAYQIDAQPVVHITPDNYLDLL
jgi:Holliday junction resolvase-like predicted endonuclease